MAPINLIIIISLFSLSLSRLLKMDFRLQLLGDRPRWGSSTSDVELKFSYVAMVFFGWIIVAAFMLMPVSHPTNVWIGPNASMLVELNSIFIKSVKVVVVVVVWLHLFVFVPSCVVLINVFFFYASPPVAVMNWSESRLVYVSHRSYGGWPYYLNKGALLNISYNVKPEGSSVRLVVNKGWLIYCFVLLLVFLLWLHVGLILGGVIQVNISESETYYLNVANPNLKDIEVELDIDVRAVVYDTKEPPFYECNFSNGECTINTMPFVGTSIVLTSPAPRPGVLAEEQEWFIRISHQVRWTSYAIVTGLVVCFLLVALELYKRFERAGEDRHHMMLIVKTLVAMKVKQAMELKLAVQFVLMQNAIAFSSHVAIASLVISAEQNKLITEAVPNFPICRKKIKKVKQIYSV
ncbi:unnamed protein product [Brassica napus]|uniref:(rape) hypothetical protein n=1 Tax=Brassica napus TaxID=3708 RepID=A0A816JPW3_BRANA|nr:unnamed protein product [Brassica napus]